jgi:hypothetical protein
MHACYAGLGRGRKEQRTICLTEKIINLFFCRYTVRAKAGGAQSTNDNSGRRVQSIGSSLRRQGEASLKEDIRGLLKAWATLISNCSVILLSVPKTMRPTLFEGENSAVLDKRDPRIRYVPFMTDKPTFETVKDMHTICSNVYFREASEESVSEVVPAVSKLSVQLGRIKEADDKARAKLSSEKAASDIAREREEALISCPESAQLFEMLRRISAQKEKERDIDAIAAELDACLDAMQRRADLPTPTATASPSTASALDFTSPITPPVLAHGVSLNLTADDMLSLPGSLDNMWTALHWACDMDIPEIILKLLEKGADPTARDVRDRTPFFLCKSKETRDTFRRFRATAEDKWNWSEAGVPEALTEEMEKIQKEKEKEKKKRAKARKAEQKRQEDREAEEARARGEEPKAKATAEAVPRAAAAADCASCNVSLFRKPVVMVGDSTCCGAECAAKYKRRLAADAAMARFASK